ncbi:MAG: Mur ligase domain-containing protein [Patescibacteria group bacterium]
MKIHFIGIGGIGVSALAQYYLAKGHEISGSDLVASEITEYLEKKGVKIIIGNSAENISQDLDLVVYSPAVKKDNPELIEALKIKNYKNLKIKIKSYPEALGDLTKEYYTIAIAGAHGKSTTTAMIGLVLTKAGFDPTVIVGTKVKEFGGSNFRMGKSKYLVIEACEYDSSFLHYLPKIIVVTNIDKEHLDYFKTFANVKKAFKNFIAKLPPSGFLVFNKRPSMRQKRAAKIKKILKVPGMHNVFNALDALEVARILKIKDEITFQALSEFTGTWRRFEEKELKIENCKLKIISDYAHHPNEIIATLKAAREKYPKKKIWCIFQPHQYQRTHYLFNDFVKVFRNAKIDKTIITDIYDVAGRETKKISADVSSKKLVKKIAKKNVIYLPMASLEKFIKENIKSGEVLIIMGAGDIYKLAEKF